MEGTLIERQMRLTPSVLAGYTYIDQLGAWGLLPLNRSVVRSNFVGKKLVHKMPVLRPLTI